MDRVAIMGGCGSGRRAPLRTLPTVIPPCAGGIAAPRRRCPQPPADGGLDCL